MNEGELVPYLQVDLDAMDRWPMVAAGCGVKLDTVCRAFLDLWRFCWRQKSGFVGLLQLECLFDMPGRGERTIEVLCALGFLEKREAGYWVSGSEKYLRITEARSRGGKSAQNNLKQGKSPGSSRKPAGKQPEVKPESSPGSGPALTANSEQREVEDLPQAAPDTRLQSAKLALVAAFSETAGSKYLWAGAKDTQALKRLLGHSPPEEIVRRWRIGLAEPPGEWTHTGTVAQLALKWNDLATAKGVRDEPKLKRLY